MHSVSLVYQYQYAHVYWLPLFPLKKDIKAYCHNCEEFINYESIKNNTTQNSIKYPLRSFFGLILIVLGLSTFMSYMYINTKQANDLTLQYINNPEVGDIYEIKYNDKEYGLARITDIKGDSIMMQMSEYIADRKSGLEDLKTKKSYKDRYYEENHGYTKEYLLNSLQDNHIIKVNRKAQ